MVKDLGKILTMQALITALLTVIAVLLPGIGTIFVVISSIVAAVFMMPTKDNNSTIDKMTKKLEDGLSAQLKSNRVQIIDLLLNPEDTSKPSFRNFRENIVAVLNKPIRETRERFDSQRHAAESIFLKKNSEREEIAEDCRRLRTERVVPLRERLQAYKDQTLKLC